MIVLRSFIKLVLFEGKIEDLQSKYTNVDVASLAEFDPSPTKKYLEWIIKQSIKKHSNLDIKSTVEFFHKNAGRFKSKDINSYEDLKDLENEVKELSLTKSKTKQKQEFKGNAKKLYEDENVLLVRPDDKNSCMSYGANTKWCITMRDANYYDDYVSNNVVFYFMINKKGQSDNPMTKIAISVQRDENNNINEVEYFDALDNSYSEPPPDQSMFAFRYTTTEPDEEPNENFYFDSGNKTTVAKLNNIALKDAKIVPKAMMAKLQSGEYVSLEGVIDYWKRTEFPTTESKALLASKIPLSYQKEIAKLDGAEYIEKALKKGHYFKNRSYVSATNVRSHDPLLGNNIFQREHDNKIFYHMSTGSQARFIESPFDGEEQEVSLEEDDRMIDSEMHRIYVDSEGNRYEHLDGLSDKALNAIGSIEHTDPETGEITYTHKPLI